MYSPVGFRLIDELSGRALIGGFKATLDIRIGTNFRATDSRAVTTASGVVAYPGLGRASQPVGAPRHYRFRVAAEFYRPLYLENSDGLEFDAPWYSDDAPPVPLPSFPQDVAFAPAASYPFASHISVLRGRVVDAAGVPVENAKVVESTHERVLTDQRGAFCLPLRWAPSRVPVAIDASDRAGRTGTIVVTLPVDLGRGQTITIN